MEKFDPTSIKNISLSVLEDQLRKTFYKDTFDQYYAEVKKTITNYTGQVPTHEHIIKTLCNYAVGDSYNPEA